MGNPGQSEIQDRSPFRGMNMRTKGIFVRMHVMLISVLSVFMLIMIFDRCSWANTGHLNEFSFDRELPYILLPVKHNGMRHLFILDTGATYTVYDLAFKKELGDVRERVKAHTYTQEGPSVLELYDAPEAYLGDYNITGSGRVTCTDLTIVNFIMGRKVSGLIGMDFLRKHAIQIDFDKGTLEFLTPEKKQGSVLGEEFVLTFVQGVPFTTVSLPDGSRADFMVDTGHSFFGSLDKRLFESLTSKQNLKTLESLIASAVGVTRSQNLRIDKFSIGPFDYEGVIFDEGDINQLGREFLERHIVTFDFPNSKLYLKKGEKFKSVDEIDMSGLHLLRISGKTIVHSVDRDSPAYKAGIRAKDEILKIGNTDTVEYDICEIRRMLMAGDNYRIMMTVKSQVGIREVAFYLRRRI
jgi:predicted aspartyl protease